METTFPLEKIQKQIREFARKRDWDQFHSPKNLAMALSVEASELLEIFQWTTEEQSFKLKDNPESHKQIQDELCDILVYLLIMADKTQTDLELAFYRKMQENDAKYPVEKSKGIAKKYTQL